MPSSGSAQINGLATSSFLALALLGCAAVPASRNPDEEVWKSVSEGNSDLATFLDYLSSDTRPLRAFTVSGPVACLVRREDLPMLISRLDSQRQSMAVKLAVSSLLRRDSSERDEAAFLIEGFRGGEYPSTGTSHVVTHEEVVALKAWWDDFEKGRIELPPEAQKCAALQPGN